MSSRLRYSKVLVSIPSILLALFAQLVIWLFHLRSDEIKMPRSLSRVVLVNAVTERPSNDSIVYKWFSFFPPTQSTKNQWKIDDPVMKMTFINEILINFDLLFLSDNY